MNNRVDTKMIKGGEVVACTKCGAKYHLTAKRVTMRDSDHLLCEVCGEVIHKWSEAKIWMAKRVDTTV